MGQQEETRSIAAHDSLTKIYNFTAFCESSRKYLLSAGAGRSMGVIYANIIDFKSVNELYGLPEGDRMLGAFADFLKHLPRTRVCGRIFSDNFLCLFERTPGVDLYDEALGFAGAVERFLVGQQPFHPRSRPQIVSGISALEGGGEGLSAAIDGANIAHKEAKRSIALPALCLMKHSKTRWRAPSVCRRTCRRRWNGSSSLFICSPR